jgi:hypothetical protein
MQPEINDATAREETLLDVLARFGRERRDGTLVALVVLGALPVLALPFLSPGTRAFALPGAAIACLGAWAMCDRSLADRCAARAEHATSGTGSDGGGVAVVTARTSRDRLLRAARWSFAVLGSAAAVAGALLAMATMIGTWIS